MKTITPELMDQAIDFCFRYKILIGKEGYGVGNFTEEKWERAGPLIALAMYETGVLDRKKGMLDSNQLSWLWKCLITKYGMDYLDGFSLGRKEKGTGKRKRTEELVRGYLDGRKAKDSIAEASDRTECLAREKLSRDRTAASCSRGGRRVRGVAR